MVTLTKNIGKSTNKNINIRKKMPTPSSGNPIRFVDIANEFGLPPGRNLGAYRIRQNVGTLNDLPLDTDIPQSVAIGSSSIRFSDFYNKRLNIVVDCTDFADNTTRQNGRTIYNTGSRNIVIGGYRGYPEDPSQNYRIYINLNTRIGSEKGTRTNCAFRTGNWRTGTGDALTSLTLELGPNAKLYGAGGDGGNSNTNHDNVAPRDPNPLGVGQNGTSALGIDYPTAVINRGRIQSGGGGGGAGGSEFYRSGKRNFRSTGGGGGGGSGFPFSTGGTSSTDNSGGANQGSAGQPGSYETRGLGGAGGTNSGAGGAGGTSVAGNNGNDSSADQFGGTGGASGFSVVIAASAAPTTTIQNIIGGVEVGDRTTTTPT